MLSLYTNVQSRIAQRTQEQSEDGLVAVEYAVLGGLIVVILGTVAAAFGTKLGTKFSALLP